MEPVIDSTSFKIVLNKDWVHPQDIPLEQYVIGCDPYEVEEPLNFWHRILAKMKITHKTKCVGWEHTVYKLSRIEGKLIVEFKGRE